MTGPEVCSTQYESECWTKNEEHNVSTIHKKQCKKVCVVLQIGPREMKKPMRRCSSKKDNKIISMIVWVYKLIKMERAGK